MGIDQSMLITALITNSFRPHDDYLLIFDPSHLTEYLYWGEGRWICNATMVHLYWHAHHKYAEDMWVISSSAQNLGLTTFLASNFVNLTHVGHTVDSAQQMILSMLSKAQDGYSPAYGAFPALRCKMNQDRWELIGAEEYMARYHAPHCSEWHFNAGEDFTILSFHRLQPQEKLSRKEMFWMHTVLYGFYVPSDLKTSIPHTMYIEDLMLGGLSRPRDYGKHAGWW